MRCWCLLPAAFAFACTSFNTQEPTNTDGGTLADGGQPPSDASLGTDAAPPPPPMPCAGRYKSAFCERFDDVGANFWAKWEKAGSSGVADPIGRPDARSAPNVLFASISGGTGDRSARLVHAVGGADEPGVTSALSVHAWVRVESPGSSFDLLEVRVPVLGAALTLSWQFGYINLWQSETEVGVGGHTLDGSKWLEIELDVRSGLRASVWVDKDLYFNDITFAKSTPTASTVAVGARTRTSSACAASYDDVVVSWQ